jgi:hypothetical protein
MNANSSLSLGRLSGADPFSNARLVEELRLHYSHILEGRYSEQFYVCFFKVIEKKIYLGYTTLAGKQIELKGILDFLHSKHYGLGITRLHDFMLAFVDQMIYDETESQYARQIVEWLRNQSYLFKFPRKVYELERLFSWIRYRKAKKKINQKEINLFILIYNKCPDILKNIGEGRDYRTFEQAAIAAGLIAAVKKRRVPFYDDMNENELRYAANQIYRIVGPTVNHRLIEILLERQESNGDLPIKYEAEQEDDADEIPCENYEELPDHMKWGSEMVSLKKIYEDCSQ